MYLKKILICTFIFGLFGCSSVMDWQTKYPDTAVEELVEEGIEAVTGADVDLTPITGKETQNINPFSEENK